MSEFDRRAITVDGVDVDVDPSALAIDDIDQAQRTSPKMIAWWASVLGSAEGEREAADAIYRQWRAKSTKALLDNDPKIAEWKAKVAIEAHPDFLKLKTAMAKATDNATTARGMFEACIRRSNLAQSVGAAKRETIRKMGDDTTREKLPADSAIFSPREKKEEEQRKKLRKVLDKAKKGTGKNG